MNHDFKALLVMGGKEVMRPNELREIVRWHAKRLDTFHSVSKDLVLQLGTLVVLFVCVVRDAEEGRLSADYFCVGLCRRCSIPCLY